VGPLIEPGCDGVAETDTLNVRVLLEPQELLALTNIVPPAAPTVAEIEVEVELPLHPDGKVHV